MSIVDKVRHSVRSLADVPQQIVSYISGGVTRIFAPSDDQYPATGVQPFEGDPAEDKQ